MRTQFFNFFLWWAVIGYSIWVGGTVFSMAVIVPMWSESPPESVKIFFETTTFNKYIFNFFGPPWMAARNLPLIVALILCWPSPLHRRYLLFALIPLLIGIVFTLTYVYPINDILMVQAGAGKSAEEIQVLADKWIFADRIRFVIMLLGYFCLLKAFKLPNPTFNKSR